MTHRVEFQIWDSFWGALIGDSMKGFETDIYGFENCSKNNENNSTFDFSAKGTAYGFVTEGKLNIIDANGQRELSAGEWFSNPSDFKIVLREKTRCVIGLRKNYLGLRLTGGPIEGLGRLKYIDGCSDTLLVSPPVLGDPCLNFLHFPTGIDQTAHSHPTIRTGIIARGRGYCVTNNKKIGLMAGQIFYIPAGTVHRFQTDEENSMDVIAFHPDSDWGPTHTVHPMINRTWVEGEKIDNSISKHQGADVVSGF